MRTIRASEIGAFLFCKRAWWYQQAGVPSQNQAELASGRELHDRHGKAVAAAGCTQTLAYGLLLAALVLLAIYATSQLL